MCPNGVEWKTLGEVCIVKTAPMKLDKKEYQEEGLYPIVDQGQKYIVGYTDNAKALVPADDYVIFGDHTREIKYVDFTFAQGADGVKILKTKNEILPRFLYHVLKNTQIQSKIISNNNKKISYKKNSYFKGKITYNDNSFYLGEFSLEFHCREGYGKITYLNGESYEGEWKNDAYFGFGIYSWPNGDKYIGEWVNNIREGIGIFICNENVYKGEFKNDAIDGFGIQTYLTGDVYKGQSLNGERNGIGIYIWKNGYEFMGCWKNNKQCGYGILEYEGKKIESEIWGEKNEPVLIVN